MARAILSGLGDSRIASVAGRAIWSSDAATGKQWSPSRQECAARLGIAQIRRGFSIEPRGRLNGKKRLWKSNRGKE